MEFSASNCSYPLRKGERRKQKRHIWMFHGTFLCMHRIFLWTQVFIRSVGSRVFSRIDAHQEVAEQIWIAQEDRNKRMWLMPSMSFRETNETVKKDWNFVYVVFGICLVCKRFQFLLGRILLAIWFYLLDIFSSFRNQHFAEKRFGLLLLCSLLVKSENYDLL